MLKDERGLYNSQNELIELDAVSCTKSPTETRWRSVLMTGVIFFLCGIENSLTGLSEWPYLHTIDKEATFTFFGTATAIANWGQVLFNILFSFWNYKYQTVRWPLIVGRALATVGSVLYICVELFPENRRYLMLFCYIIFAIAAILRTYIVLNSSEQDRSRAWSVISLANVISIIVGPLIQLAFSRIEYPGKTIVEGIYFNLFSAPIWVATVLNLVTIPLIFFVLPEMAKHPNSRELGTRYKKLSEESNFSLKWLKSRWQKIKSLDVSWILVGLVIFERVMITMSLGTIQYVISPMMISVWALTNSEVVTWVAAAMIIVGVLAVITSGIFMATPLTRKISSRNLLLIAFITGIIMYILSFPYPFVSQPIPAYNVTTETGCSSAEYAWCSTRAANIWVFMSVVLLAMGIAVPTTNISLDSIYSKVVEEANQSIMQGVVTMFDAIVNVVGPFYAAQVFTKAGPTVFWIVNGSITIIGALVWLVAFRWMAKY